MHVSLPVDFLWTHGKMFTVICLPVASTEAVNKSVGKGKKVNTTKGDKKLQQPEQEVGSTGRYRVSLMLFLLLMAMMMMMMMMIRLFRFITLFNIQIMSDPEGNS